MKRLLLFGMIFGLCGVGAETLIAQQAASQPRVRSTQPIRLSRCRIQLRDRATLASERAGILETVDLEEGDEVREGQEVARLKDDVVSAAVVRAEKRPPTTSKFATPSKLRKSPEPNTPWRWPRSQTSPRP